MTRKEYLHPLMKDTNRRIVLHREMPSPYGCIKVQTVDDFGPSLWVEVKHLTEAEISQLLKYRIHQPAYD